MDQLSAQFAEAGTLMLAGMGVVFVFLSMLIVAVKLLSAFAAKYPDPVPQVKAPRPRANTNDGKLSPSLVAAISSAVVRYRNNNKINK